MGPKNRLMRAVLSGSARHKPFAVRGLGAPDITQARLEVHALPGLNSVPRSHQNDARNTKGGLELLVANYGLYKLRCDRARKEFPTLSRGFASKDLPPHEVLTMPSLSPTMAKGNIAEWKKKEGEQVMAGDVLGLIETDKSTMDYESLEDGFVAKILVPGGTQDIPVGQPIIVIAENADDVSAFAGFSADVGGAPVATATSAPVQAATSAPAESAKSHAHAAPPPPDRIGPSARKLLAESAIDWTQIKPTGPRGLITKGDVLAAIASGATSAPRPVPQKAAAPAAAPPPPPPPRPLAGSPAPSSDGDYVDIPNSNIRRIIAKRLLESKIGIPHLYLTADTRLDATLALRKELKAKYSQAVSVNDFVIRAAALALRAVPKANAYWDEQSGEILDNPTVDISVAVATDKGLLTPVIRNADQKSLSEISAEVKALAEKARAGRLKPEEFTGGTFTISNLGMFSIDHFSAIINPPQACIMAVGGGKKAVVWKEGVGEEEGDVEVVTKMVVTLSADHRVYNGEIAGKFLAKFTSSLENPHQMIL